MSSGDAVSGSVRTFVVAIRPERTDEGPPEPLTPYRSYLRLTAVDLSVSLPAGSVPLIVSQLRLDFGGVPTTLPAIATAPRHLTDLVPYTGGEVEATVAVLALPARDDVLATARLLEELSALIEAPLASHARLAGRVADAIAGLESVGAQAHMAAAPLVECAPSGEGNEGLRAGYYVVVLADPGKVDPTALRVVGGRLAYQAQGDDFPSPPTFDHLLVRLEAQRERDRWDTLDFGPEVKKAVEALSKHRTEEAEWLHTIALTRAWRSPDLTEVDHRRVVHALNEEMKVIALEGPGAVGDKDRGLEEIMVDRAVPVDDVATVEPMSAYEVFADLTSTRRAAEGSVRRPQRWRTTRGAKRPTARDQTVVTPDEAAASPAPGVPPPAYARLDCPPVVVADEEFELEFGLSPAPVPGVIGDKIDVPAADYHLAVQIHAEGFSIREGESWRRETTVTGDDRFPEWSLTLRPDVVPTGIAPRAVQALYSINGQTVGLAVRPVTVVAIRGLVPHVEPSPEEPAFDMTIPRAADVADLTARILVDDEHPGRLCWYLESPHIQFPETADESTVGDARKFVKELVEGVSAAQEQPGIFEKLMGIGRRVADKIPETFWDGLRAIHASIDRAPNILFLSAEPYVPWELAVLERPLFDGQAPPFLGAQAHLGRWVLGRRKRPRVPPPAELAVRSMSVVSGVYGKSYGWRRLPEAEAEAKHFADEYGATPIDATLPAVLDLIKTRPLPDLIHFAVHGSYDQTGIQDGLILVDGYVLDPDRIEGVDQFDGAPFVFLNACQVGAMQEDLGDPAGVAAAFLRAGAAGVIAPLWSVKDSVAKDVALDFYRELFGATECQPAVLLRMARSKFSGEGVSSATYLAYQFFGHPSMKLTRLAGPANGETT